MSSDQIETELQHVLQQVRSKTGLDTVEFMSCLEVIKVWAISIARRQVGWSRNPQDTAEEIAQQFIDCRFLKGLHGYNPTRNLRPYCVTAIARLSISRLRMERRRTRIERKIHRDRRNHTYGGSKQESYINSVGDKARVRRALLRLARHHRRAVILQFWFDLTAKEGAKRLGVLPSQFTRWSYEGRRQLRGDLGPSFDDAA